MLFITVSTLISALAGWTVLASGDFKSCATEASSSRMPEPPPDGAPVHADHAQGRISLLQQGIPFPAAHRGCRAQLAATELGSSSAMPRSASVCRKRSRIRNSGDAGRIHVCCAAHPQGSLKPATQRRNGHRAATDLGARPALPKTSGKSPDRLISGSHRLYRNAPDPGRRIAGWALLQRAQGSSAYSHAVCQRSSARPPYARHSLIRAVSIQQKKLQQGSALLAPDILG